MESKKQYTPIGIVTAKFIKFLFIFCFFIFIIPANILEKSQICKNFVDFMSGIFINIDMFSETSAIPQATAFYMSVLWLVSIFVFIGFFVDMTHVGIVGYCDKSFMFLLVTAVFFLLCLKWIYDFYLMGEILSKGYRAYNKAIYVNLSSRLSIGIWITMLQISVSMLLPVICAFFVTLPYTLIIKIISHPK